MSEVISGPAAMPVTYEAKLERYAQIQSERAALDAEEQELLASLASDVPSWMTDADAKIHTAKQWVREEVAAIARISWQAAGYRIRIATSLTSRFPTTVAMLREGKIWFWHARFLAEETVGLDDEAAALIEARVLKRAEGQSLTDFKAAVRRAIKAITREDAEAERQRALEQRRIVISHQDDGMAEIWAKLPSEAAVEIEGAIEAMVGEIRQPDEVRTIEQIRADAFIALTHRRTTDGQPVGPSVHVTMTLATALDLADEPAELAGVGPITAEHARRIAFTEGATWRRLVTDPLGRAIDLSTKAYRPPPRLRRLVETRDQTCRFPHCRRKATRCELDHCVARAANGQTCEHNLHCLCARHHHMKHEAGWHPVMHKNGTTTWTSPTGRTYDIPPYLHPVDPPDEHEPKAG